MWAEGEREGGREGGTYLCCRLTNASALSRSTGGKGGREGREEGAGVGGWEGGVVVL